VRVFVCLSVCLCVCLCVSLHVSCIHTGAPGAPLFCGQFLPDRCDTIALDKTATSAIATIVASLVPGAGAGDVAEADVVSAASVLHDYSASDLCKYVRDLPGTEESLVQHIMTLRDLHAKEVPKCGCCPLLVFVKDESQHPWNPDCAASGCLGCAAAKR
jgi:hypothetical protein